MVAALLDRITGGGGTAALTAPRVTLRSGGGAGGGGGLAGAIGGAVGGAVGGAAGNMLGGGGDDELGSRVLALTLTRGILPMLDLAEIHLAPEPGGGAPDAGLPALDAPLTLGLQAGDAAGSFTGTVAEREPRATGEARLVLGNGGALLARLRVDETHSDRKPGEIAADLCGRLGIAFEGIKGAPMPRCALHAAMPAHLQVARLAAMADAVAAFDDAGALWLIDDTAGGESMARLEAGGNLLDWHLTERRPTRGALTVDGAGVEGASRWGWLRKTPGPMRATAGTGAPARALAAPALRSPAGVEAMAGALARAGTRATARARFLVLGAPGVVPAGRVTVEGVEGASGEWFVLRVTHRLDLAHGLLSEIAAAPAGGGGGISGLLGGLL
jgi:hypothetical protein